MISLALTGRATLLRRTLQRPHQLHCPGHRLQTTHASKTVGEGYPQTSNGTAQTQHGNASTAVPPESIPSPTTWLHTLQTPLRHYTSINRRRPYVTQVVSSLTIYLLGDLLSQYITSSPPAEAAAAVAPGENTTAAETDEKDEQPTTSSSAYDPKRTARALIIGGIASIPAYHWFMYLHRSFNYASTLLSLGTKVLVNQLTFTAVFNCYFFGMQQLLTQAMAGEIPQWRAITERISNTVPRSWWNSWKVWPAVTAFSFWAVPAELRSPFAGVIAIGWQTYLSVLNQRAAREERRRAVAMRMEEEEGKTSGSTTATRETSAKPDELKRSTNEQVKARC